MIIILHDYQVINRHADRQQNDDGNITIIISLWSLWSSWLDHHNHYYYHNNLCHNHYLVQSTRTGWKRTIFCAQMGVAGRALQPNIRIPRQRHFRYHDRQQHFSALQGNLGSLLHTYIHIYTFIPTIYTNIYNTYNIPTIYTNIYNYIQKYM